WEGGIGMREKGLAIIWISAVRIGQSGPECKRTEHGGPAPPAAPTVTVVMAMPVAPSHVAAAAHVASAATPTPGGVHRLRDTQEQNDHGQDGQRAASHRQSLLGQRHGSLPIAARPSDAADQYYYGQNYYGQATGTARRSGWCEAVAGSVVLTQSARSE